MKGTAMAGNEFSVGRDCQLVVMGPFGRIDLAHVIGFERRLASEPPKGWEGTFELERGGNAADDFLARIGAAYNDGGPVPAGTLYQYVSETDGSVSTYQYDGAVFRIPAGGRFNARQRVEFFASSRRRI
jgi:hypothetical protein